MAITQKHTQLETQLEAECSEANNLIQQTFKGKFIYFLFCVGKMTFDFYFRVLRLSKLLFLAGGHVCPRFEVFDRVESYWRFLYLV